MIAAVEDALREVDVLLCASAMDPPSRIDDPAEIERTYPRQARTPFNVTGHPALAMMAGLSSTACRCRCSSSAAISPRRRCSRSRGRGSARRVPTKSIHLSANRQRKVRFRAVSRLSPRARTDPSAVARFGRERQAGRAPRSCPPPQIRSCRVSAWRLGKGASPAPISRSNIYMGRHVGTNLRSSRLH